MSDSPEIVEWARRTRLAERLGVETVGEALSRLRLWSPPAEGDSVLRRTLRRKTGSGRFPPEFERAMLDTERLNQQASSWRAAVHLGRGMAEAIRRVGCRGRLWDLCCGLGMDAIGLARADLDVRAVDASIEALACSAWNAEQVGLAERISLRCARAEESPIEPDDAVHADPDRRAAGRRARGLADYEPGEAFLRALPERSAVGSVKLSPALDAAALGEIPGAGLEYLSEGRTCRQLRLCWPAEAWGFAAPGRTSGPVPVRATVLAGPMNAPRVTALDAGLADPPEPVGLPEAGAFVIEPDPAVVAAGAVDDLAEALSAARVHAALDWLTAPAPAETPLARSYEVLSTAPGRLRHVRRALADLDAGPVEVKPRGLRLDTDALARGLRGKGPQPVTVFWGRLGRREVTILTRRI